MTRVKDVPDIHFAPARGARIAYQLFGTGTIPMVAVPPAAQNIEAAWERREIRSMLERFGSFTRYLVFDKRGTGASDRSLSMPGIDEYVDDLRAVMDDAGIDRAHLFAQSEGGPMTLMFAATYPHRVHSVILVGSAARLGPERTAEEREATRGRIVDFCSVWGTPESRAIDVFAPSRVGDEDFRTWHQRYERVAASSDSLRDLMFQMMDVDVREVLPDLEVPVLVVHRRDDRAIPLAFGREVAELVADSTMFEVPGEDHFLYIGDTDAVLDEIERFVTGAVTPRDDVGPTTARITTLGRFAAIIDGREVETSEWGSRRARTLLKRLVVARGWPVTRDELIELLWPGDDEVDKLGARLSVQLSAVRRILGGGVVADRETVALDLGHVSCDIDEFLRSVDDDAIVEQYAGEFLPEDRYEDWSRAIRDEARSHFTLAAHRVIDAAAEHGDWLRVAEIARRLLDADPYDEAAHRRLVDALGAAGDATGAERARDAWSAALTELGVEPNSA